MSFWVVSEEPDRMVADASSVVGDAVPFADRGARRPSLVSPAARKALLNRMLLFRQASMDRVTELTGASPHDLQKYRQELVASGLPDTLLERGAGVAFTHELPQGSLLYLLVRGLRPSVVVETGVGPGYSTAWILAALEDNHHGELTSLGPGPTAGRHAGVHDVALGQFVPPTLRSRWTLALGNTEDRLREILAGLSEIDVFLYDNGPVAARARFEMHAAWERLSAGGVLLAHHVDSNPAWDAFCRSQGVPPQILDPGPPPMGAVGMKTRSPA
jgi:predicted O-methyltransferase YrrM